MDTQASASSSNSAAPTCASARADGNGASSGSQLGASHDAAAASTCAVSLPTPSAAAAAGGAGGTNGDGDGGTSMWRRWRAGDTATVGGGCSTINPGLPTIVTAPLPPATGNGGGGAWRAVVPGRKAGAAARTGVDGAVGAAYVCGVAAARGGSGMPGGHGANSWRSSSVSVAGVGRTTAPPSRASTNLHATSRRAVGGGRGTTPPSPHTACTRSAHRAQRMAAAASPAARLARTALSMHRSGCAAMVPAPRRSVRAS